MTEEMTAKLTELIDALNAIDPRSMPTSRGTVGWHLKDRKKFIALDAHGSGYFLVDKETGELYNIKGYGVPDRNKKAKADIGNIMTVNPARLFELRYNYLRGGL